IYCLVSSMILGSSSLPGRLCPAITARGLSDSILSSAEIHSLRFCVVGQLASHGWVPLKTASPATANSIDATYRHVSLACRYGQVPQLLIHSLQARLHSPLALLQSRGHLVPDQQANRSRESSGLRKPRA